MKKLYISVDGDDVGSRLEYLILSGALGELQEFSTNYKKAMAWLKDELRSHLDATIIFDGGDSLLATIPELLFDKQLVESIRHRYLQESERTISIGIGNNSRDAYVALKIAKASGKNRLIDLREIDNE